MKIFETPVSSLTGDFFLRILSSERTLPDINDELKSISGINDFIATKSELDRLQEMFFGGPAATETPGRVEYGDFQTSIDLATRISRYLSQKRVSPAVLIEPTCGKGNFILAALKSFKTLRRIYGIEIYKPYTWETKFAVLDFFLQNPSLSRPDITISDYNVFDFDFGAIASENNGKDILIIGNPPWATNSMLGALNSRNLPQKSNFKKQKGLDAITGKGNFDIAEHVALRMLEAFHEFPGHLALLVKNSVIKNIVYDQRRNNNKIGEIEKHTIDSKKEFNVSADASLFFCALNAIPSHTCCEFDFYDIERPGKSFGWIKDRFVSDAEAYNRCCDIDGDSPMEWRQGLKHDCSAIMELDKINGHYINGLREEANLEEDMVFGILKSSDLKNTVIDSSRKYTIVTQKKPGQDTQFIRKDFPRTYLYLQSHRSIFEGRKSAIYKNKPLFSIFGIGEYSFKPYKVAISGLYKTFHFTLVLPQCGKPLMLDDTCYMLGFDTINFAVYTLILLNLPATTDFLKSLTFAGAKRTFTKDILMRVDLHKLSLQISFHHLEQEIDELNEKYKLNADSSNWTSYIRQLSPGARMKMHR